MSQKSNIAPEPKRKLNSYGQKFQPSVKEMNREYNKY